MFYLFELAILFSSISFISYGSSCLLSSRMNFEFQRYQLPRLRVLTGCLQISAGIGLIIGFRLPIVLLAASLILGLMMFFAIIVRIRIKDSFLQMIPALVYLILNSYIFTICLKNFSPFSISQTPIFHSILASIHRDFPYTHLWISAITKAIK